MMILQEGKISALVFLLLTCILAYYYINQAKKGTKTPIRRLPALDALDEGVARAVEMGRPIHFSLGTRAELTRPDILPMTLAGLAVLSYISRLSARLGARIVNTVCRSQIVALCEDTIKTAYILEDKEEEFNPNMVQFLAEAPNTYQMGLNGVFERERPATNIFMGGLGGEALYLVELGNIYGAMTIGGTARPNHLPFVVAGSDFFLIGEELFAAGAYLNEDEVAFGSIKSQDIVRSITIILILLGSILIWMGNTLIFDLLSS